MRKFCLLLVFLPLCLFAQRYTGYGRGSDEDFSGGSSLIGYAFWIILLVVIGVCILLYSLFKDKFGKKEWTYREFCSKYSRPSIGRKLNGYIDMLSFETAFGDHVYVSINNAYYHNYFDLWMIEHDAAHLIIKQEGSDYILYKK